MAMDTPTLTEVLIRNAVYSYGGVLRIAINDFTLQDITGDNTVVVSLGDVTLVETPGSPEWCTRMARTRRSMVGMVVNLKNDNENLTQWKQGIRDAIREKAIEKDWCEEYDEFAEEWDLPKRTSEWDVTMTVRVLASTEEDALEKVRNRVSLDPYHTEGVVEGPEFEASGV